MPKLPAVTARDVVRALERDGWFVARTTGHHQMRHPTKPGTIPVPNHPSQDIDPSTLRSIIRLAGLSVDEFRRLL